MTQICMCMYKYRYIKVILCLYLLIENFLHHVKMIYHYYSYYIIIKDF